jgi:CrcB protein
VIYLYIGAGGFLGSVSRYAIDNLARAKFDTAFPAGTFIVNVAGCLLIGFIMTLALERIVMSVNARMGIVTGFLGGLTTFSTYTYQTLMLMEKGAWGMAGWYSTASVITCIFAVWLGAVLAKAIPFLLPKGLAQRKSPADFKN